MILPARLSHKWVGFWPSFSDAWLGSFRPERDDVLGEYLEQLIEEAGLFSGAVVSGIEGAGPLPKGIDRALEAEAFDGNMVQGGGLLHEGANEVVGDRVHGDLLADHGRGLAAEHVHAKRDLDVPEEQLHGPSTEIQFGEFFGRIGNGVQQGGDHDERLGSKAGDVD